MQNEEQNTKTIERTALACAKWANLGFGWSRRISPWLLGLAVWVEASPLVWAAKKKVEEEAAPTKSYVVPYMIVISFLSIGLMTICRPTARAEKLDDKRKNDDE